MLYKTITLELLKEHYDPATGRPTLHDLERQTTLLKAAHESWMAEIQRSRPESSPEQQTAEALELAIRDLRTDLSSASSAAEATEDLPNLDAAMAFLKMHTPRG